MLQQRRGRCHHCRCKPWSSNEDQNVSMPNLSVPSFPMRPNCPAPSSLSHRMVSATPQCALQERGRLGTGAATPDQSRARLQLPRLDCIGMGTLCARCHLRWEEDWRMLWSPGPLRPPSHGRSGSLCCAPVPIQVGNASRASKPPLAGHLLPWGRPLLPPPGCSRRRDAAWRKPRHSLHLCLLSSCGGHHVGESQRIQQHSAETVACQLLLLRSSRAATACGYDDGELIVECRGRHGCCCARAPAPVPNALLHWLLNTRIGGGDDQHAQTAGKLVVPNLN